MVFDKLEDVFVPKGLGKIFLVTEDGSTDKILIFSSTLARRTMRNYRKVYYADGTCKCVPQPFYQLFSLHLDLNSDESDTNIIPVLYHTFHAN